MTTKKADLIRLLEAELDVVEGGGYGRSVHEPQVQPPMFKHSLACINHWEVPGHEAECHTDCVLMDFVPQEHKNEAIPCHFIQLNEHKDTAHSLEENQERMEEAVKQWLRATISRLKAEAAQSTEPNTVEAPY